MSKLYPPYIEGKLPACGGDSLVIPFEMNRSVSVTNVGGIVAIIKTVTTGREIGILNGQLSTDFASGKCFANFNLRDLNTPLNIGQFYKVQIACKNKDNGEIGYYSNVGVFKKTALPSITVSALSDNFLVRKEYTGVYNQQGKDETEKVYSYSFEIRDRDGNYIDGSGTQIHDSTKDSLTYESTDSWRPTVELEKNIAHYLIYKVTTVNNLECQSQRYTIINQDSVDIDIDMEIEAKLNIDEAKIDIYIQPEKAQNNSITGTFVLLRASSLTNFGVWDEVKSFSFINTYVTKNQPLLLWSDYTIKQGEEYIYAIQAYNSRGLYSNRLEIKNKKVTADFVDTFLYDGKRQLKIKFNPKVSSFKNNILETKTDTIGGKHPFIFRNGNVHYKEFPVSGLISMLSDENGEFIPIDKELYPSRKSTPSGEVKYKNLSTNLTSDNIYNEREFKMEVLEWLNNGEPKVFKSPTEGNFIVYLMNVSLTPNDTLGRMLHTFNCTAYEIADWNFNNLLKFDFIKFTHESSQNLKLAQIQPYEMMKMSDEEFVKQYYIFDRFNDKKEIRFYQDAYQLQITEAHPGTRIGIVLSSGTGEMIDVEIGASGTYIVQVDEYPVFSISLLSGTWEGMKITFEYYDNIPLNSFSEIVDITVMDEIRRFVGPGYHYNLLAINKNLAHRQCIISDIRREIGDIHYIKVEKRYVENVWKIKDGVYARNKDKNDIIGEKEWNPLYIYYDVEANKYYSGSISDKTGLAGAPDFRFSISEDDKDYVDLGIVNPGDESGVGQTFGRIGAIYDLKDLSAMRVGNGVLVDIAYRVTIKEYEAESTVPKVKATKNAWEIERKNLSYLLSSQSVVSYKELENKLAEVDKFYTNFINELETELKRRGVI